MRGHRLRRSQKEKWRHRLLASLLNVDQRLKEKDEARSKFFPLIVDPIHEEK